MAATENAQLLENLDMLVVDERKIVSFKWLSRAFSLPSTKAKEILEAYSRQKKDAVQAIYLVSGWTRGEPRTYSIQLVGKSRLEGTVASLEEASSHVYSVQPSIPKDPAALWTPDFIQAEELFNQPPEQDNCLRNNSLSAVAFPHVTRTPGGGRKAAVVPAPATTEAAPKAVTAKGALERPAATSPASPLVKKDDPEEAVPRSAKLGTTPKAGGRGAKPKAARAKGGLANLWGKAPPVKAKAAVVKAEADKGAGARAGDAEARIRAMEDAQGASSGEEEEELAPRGMGGRRRRVALDEEEEEEEVENGREAGDEDVEMDEADGVNGVADAVMRESEDAERGEEGEAEEMYAVDLDAPTPREWKDGSIPGAKPAEAAAPARGGAAGGGPKRRKVARSTFDEKGREVVEMVWEDEVEKGGDAAAAPVAPEPMEEEPKAPAPVKSVPTKVAKDAEKPKGPAKKAAPAAKGGKKGAQGNILSFFKKK